MNIFIRLIAGIVVGYLIWVYLLPLVPSPLHFIVQLLLVLAAIYWLIKEVN
jgi:F0F1-type ATP synthase assembly protein I